MQDGTKYDMTIGCRDDAHSPSVRRPGKRLIKLIIRCLVADDIPDFNSGHRLVKRTTIIRYLNVCSNRSRKLWEQPYMRLWRPGIQKRVQKIDVVLKKIRCVLKQIYVWWKHVIFGPALLYFPLLKWLQYFHCSPDVWQICRKRAALRFRLKLSVLLSVNRGQHTHFPA